MYTGSALGRRLEKYGWARVSGYERCKLRSNRGESVRTELWRKSCHMRMALSTDSDMNLRVWDPTSGKTRRVECIATEDFFMDFLQSYDRHYTGTARNHCHTAEMLAESIDASPAEDSTWGGLTHTSPLRQGVAVDAFKQRYFEAHGARWL